MTAHWAINGRFLSQSATGVQRYATEVVRSLDRLLTDDPHLATKVAFEIIAPADAVEPVSLRTIGFRRIGRPRGHLWEQTVLPAHAAGGLISLCNTGPVCHRRQIVCIHDLNTRTCPNSYSRSFRAAYRILTPLLGRTAATVTTVSHHSAGDLVRFGICAREKIRVIPNGHEHVHAWQSAHSTATRRVADGSRIVVIGSPAAHKNVGLVLGLAERLEAVGIGIVVVGAADPRIFRNMEREGPDNVTWLGRTTDAELAALLQDCLCLAFPSLAEGFGLPPIEAMALGCPTVVSDRAPMPEICGGAALYASPDDPEAWLRHFVELHRSPELRRCVIQRGLDQALRFSWRGAAQSYLAAVQDLA